MVGFRQLTGFSITHLLDRDAILNERFSVVLNLNFRLTRRRVSAAQFQTRLAFQLTT